MTPDDIQVCMLKKAACLSSATQNEEAWHLIGLFQSTQPITFLQICHHTLASFLELSHDYFSGKWPLTSRLTRSRACSRSTKRGHHNPNNDFQEIFESPIDTRAYSMMDHCRTIKSDIAHDLNYSSHRMKVFKMTNGKRFLNQLLPSKTIAPIQSRMNCSDCDLSTVKQSETKTIRGRSVQNGPIDYAVHVPNKSSVDPTMMNSSCPNSVIPLYSNFRYNGNATISTILIEYMLSDPRIYTTEFLFRVPGNNGRIKELHQKLMDYFQAPYCRIPQPEPHTAQLPHSFSPIPCFNPSELANIFRSYSPHDLASLLLRCLNICSGLTPQATYIDGSSMNLKRTNEQSVGGIIPIEAGNLLFRATSLQYTLENSTSFFDNSDGNFKDRNDWMYVLCRSRQLLTYRVVVQLLLPTPEKYLLLNLLRLFKLISGAQHISKMSTVCLARCTAFAVFGLPVSFGLRSSSSSALIRRNRVARSPEQCTMSLKWRIDTLVNLIQSVEELNDLPSIIYESVRQRLRSHLGDSPLPKTAIGSNTFNSSITSKPVCCSWQKQYSNEDKENIVSSPTGACSYTPTQRCHRTPFGLVDKKSAIKLLSKFECPLPKRTKVDRAKSDLNRSRSRDPSSLTSPSIVSSETVPCSKSSLTIVDPFLLWKRQKSSTGSGGGVTQTKPSKFVKCRSTSSVL